MDIVNVRNQALAAKAAAVKQHVAAKKLTPEEIKRTLASDPKSVDVLCVFSSHTLDLVAGEKTMVEVDGKLTWKTTPRVFLTFKGSVAKVSEALAGHIKAMSGYKRDYAIKEELNEASRASEKWAAVFIENCKQRSEAAGKKFATREEVTL